MKDFKNMSETQNWQPCARPSIGDTLRWNEPLWAAPNKPRGKRDKVGEQQITATLKSNSEFLEFEVLEVTKLSGDDAAMQVKQGDAIRRKKKTLDLGECHKAIA
jgi:hypothetical protein